ncbi:hypothetical protein KY327_00800 [Candidatus Woesearchaeota archaeon]|nr:hypothetical protein [Candidatus Woesearchaeota archaeon]
MALRRIERRKERRNRIIMAVVVAFLMVMSGFGVYLSGRGAQDQTIKDYGVTFAIDQNTRTYTADFTGQDASYYYLPSSVEQYVLSTNGKSLLRGSQALVLTFDPEAPREQLGALSEVRLDLSSLLQKPVINAVTTNTSAYALPVVTCDNATAEVPVVSFEIDNETALVTEGSCLRVRGNGTAFYELRDALVYSYYGVYESS